MDNQVADEVIIGSGPTAWACAEGVWSRGGKPTIIDIGYTADFKSGEAVASGAVVSLKHNFGSSHMYQYPIHKLQMSLAFGVTPISGALGGFSTVWGAGIQPVSTHDLSNMPNVTKTDWLHSSKILLSKMNILGADDCLSHRDPWPVNPNESVQLSTRFQKIQSRAVCANSSHTNGTVYGSPRLAIAGRNPEASNTCTLCGKCMSGCPEDSIFDSGKLLLSGIGNQGGEYLKGCVVGLEIISQLNNLRIVQVNVLRDNGSYFQILAKRIYLAAGPIATATLLQRSRMVPEYLKVQDSQMFYSGFLCRDRYRSSNHFMSTSQGYFATDTTVEREEEFSCSVYEYSHDFESRLFEIASKVIRPPLAVMRPLIKRLVPGIGFIAPEVSGSFVLCYKNESVQIFTETNDKTESAIKTAQKRIGKLSKKLGLILLPNPFPTPPVGSGFHVGSSVPMGYGQTHLTDWNGSLKKFPEIKIVDASSLPRIRAGSHTFMAMANAYRIAKNQ